MTLPFHSQVPEIRCWPANSANFRQDGEFVVYWMTSQRRPSYNFALQRAVEWARHLQRPLIVLEALRIAYPWACHRFHRFVMQGMQDHLEHFAATPVTYYPYVEPSDGQGSGLLQSLASRACLVVGDHFPCFFLPRMVAAVAPRLPILLELVDSNGLLPLKAAPKVYERAVDFRRFLQKNLKPHLQQFPLVDPLLGPPLPRLAQPLPEWQRWPAATMEMPSSVSSAVAEVSERGGFETAQQVMERFLEHRLPHYSEHRSEPSKDFASGLSPYLHFGHISTHELLDQLGEREDWSLDKLCYRPTGSKDGSWGMTANSESFLDELVTWRELGYNMAHFRDDYDRYESLPAWARNSLEEHQQDPRQYTYSLEEFEEARTHDRLWNAAQRQLRQEGRIQNYLRMLWGKKVLEWTRHPREALDILIELNNKYALDGRNPNSYSGIFWCLGRYDRPWFKRAIFGVIRYMSCDSAARKFKLDGYLARWGEGQGQLF